jgi:transposase
VKTGEVVGETTERDASDDFVRFLQKLVQTQPNRREIHVVLDNLSTHKTQKVRGFLAAHPNVHLQFTPTYPSWLSPIEPWFAKIARDLLAGSSHHARTCDERSCAVHQEA